MSTTDSETDPTEPDPEALREAVRARYAAAVVEASCAGDADGCCTGGPTCCAEGPSAVDPIIRDLYGEEAELIAPGTLAASLGCGNPTVLADLRPGQAVLDLGSGGGLDVLLSPGGSARPAGHTGWT